MRLSLIQCRGKCKLKKSHVCFRPSDLRSKRPICRECRKSYVPVVAGTKRDRGWLWRQQSNTLCPGSAKAMERIGAL